MIDSRNLSIIETNPQHVSVVEENIAIKTHNRVLVGCLTVLSVTIIYICYVEYQRQKLEA